MVYSKGSVQITIEQVDGFGKNPGLWIGAGNELLKVASFGNYDKAIQFCKWLEYFLGKGEEPTLKGTDEHDV